MIYRSFVFDLDGTLADTSPGVFAGIRYALSEMKRDPLPEDKLRLFIGPPLQNSFSNIAGMSPSDTDTAVDHFRVYYEERGVYETALYPGMKELLLKLKESGATLMVGSLKRELFTIHMIEHLGISPLFSAVVGCDDGASRTKTDIINLALAKAGVTDRSSALMVGDSEYDAIGAKEAGIAFCGALYGFGLNEKNLANNPYACSINSPLELLEQI